LALFPLGRLLSTPGAVKAFAAAGDNPLVYLQRHLRGDWSDVDQEDWQANNRAIVEGARIFSSYSLSNGVWVWLITESHRAATTSLTE
jgi:hypothetical protein